MPSQIYAHWNFVFHRDRQERGWVDLEIGESRRDGSGDADLIALRYQLERNLFVLGGLTRELDLEIGLNGCRAGSGFGQPRAHRDHGKLCASRHLNHMNVAVAIARIKRFNGYGDQEIALSIVTNALASGRMTDALTLMQRVRDVIGESGLFQNPLTVRRWGKPREREKQDDY